MGQLILEDVCKEFGCDTVRLALDPSRLYFFSPETGESMLRRAA